MTTGTYIEKKIWDFWKSKGASDWVAAAWLGNTEGEDSFELTAIGDGGKAYGTSQWHWVPRGENILAAIGVDIRRCDLDGQLNAAWWEINHANGYSHVWKLLQSTKTVDTAVATIVHFYEQSGSQKRDIVKRSDYANYWLQKFGGQS